MSIINGKGISLPHLAVIIAFGCLICLTIYSYWSSIPALYTALYPAPAPKDKQHFLSDVTEDKPILLLWDWPGNYRFDFSDCKTIYNIDSCNLTDDRSLYNDSDAVLIFHEAISWNLSSLPPSPHPPFQKWIWFHVEPPTKIKKIPGLENLFNLTLSYKQDADIPVQMSLITSKKPNEEFVILKKDKLVCWFLSKNDSSTGVGTRNKFYQEFSKYINVTVIKTAYVKFLDYYNYYQTMARCKFYLVFQNSIYNDYITDKLSRPLAAGTVPVVLGPPRKNYANFVPAESFIHVNDFPDAKSLAEYLLQLDKDKDAYRKYFDWRKHLNPTLHLIQQTQEFILPICTACDYVARHREYKEES
ncbi:hypothetical protein QQF64_031353 [Cirrhinus molitorella]|uniref:Fucosyltransferase n=1 Tax=Cirrhinus molitorella TaxID=172907 RepID=A0ABR3MWP5_9TELE